MNDKAKMQELVELYISGINSNDLSNIPLTQTAVYTGSMLSEPVCGDMEIRNYLQETAPFVESLNCLRLVVEENAAVALVAFSGINGVQVEGTFFFDAIEGSLSEIRAIFDTRPLFKGGAN